MPNKKKDYQIWTDQNTWADVFARFNKKKQKKNHSNKYILIAILFAFVGLIVILDSGIKLKEVHFERTIKEVELHNLNLKMNERLKMGVREEIIHLAGIYDFDLEIALNMAERESQFGKYNYNWEGSSAKGIYQFINLTWENYCQGDVLNQTDNIKCFLELYPEHSGWWEV